MIMTMRLVGWLDVILMNLMNFFFFFFFLVLARSLVRGLSYLHKGTLLYVRGGNWR